MIDEKKIINDIKQWNKEREIKWTTESVISLLESAPKIGGWIPCSERLPDKWEDVMICYYNDREEKHLSDIACLDDNGCWQLLRESGGYFPYNFKKKITHWRPLPNLPEEYHG